MRQVTIQSALAWPVSPAALRLLLVSLACCLLAGNITQVRNDKKPPQRLPESLPLLLLSQAAAGGPSVSSLASCLFQLLFFSLSSSSCLRPRPRSRNDRLGPQPPQPHARHV
jgi:hypothetical protein